MSRTGTKVSVSIDDAEALLNTLLMLTTFTLGFSISFLAAFGHGDLLEMDHRFLTIFADVDKKKVFGATGGGDTFSPSSTILFRGILSTALLSVSLAIGLGAYLSLLLSNCREDERFYNRWWRWNIPPILIGYILYFIGFITFYATVSISAIGVFPKYCKFTYGDYTSAWIYKDESYNATSDTINEGCVSDAMLSPVGNTVTALNVIMPVVTVGLVLGSLAIRWTDSESLQT